MDDGPCCLVIAAPLYVPVTVEVVASLVVAYRQVVVGLGDLLDADVASAGWDDGRLDVADADLLVEVLLDGRTRRAVAVTDAALVLASRRLYAPVTADHLRRHTSRNKPLKHSPGYHPLEKIPP